MKWRATFSLIIFLLVLFPGKASALPLPENLAEESRTKLLQMINESREKEGFAPLKENAQIERVAQAHAEDTAQHFDPTDIATREATYLAHTSADGGSLADRFTEAKVSTGWGYAENTGYWTRTPFGELTRSILFGLTLMHEGMMREVSPNDAHRKNILGPYTDIGIGLSLFDEPGDSWNVLFLVSDFSRITSEEEERNFRNQEYSAAPSRTLIAASRIPAHGGPFVDVRPDDSFAAAIAEIKQRGIIQGYDDGTFRPDAAVARAEFVKMLLDATGENPIGREYEQCFSDVFNEWFGPYICLAKRQGWVKGYPDGSFRPADTVSRAEGVTLTSRLFIATEKSAGEVIFRDVSADAWFASPIKAMEERDLLPFQGRLFFPERALTRGETAEMLYRVMRLQEEATGKTEEPSQGAKRRLKE